MEHRRSSNVDFERVVEKMKTFGEVFPKRTGLFSHMPNDAPWAGALIPERMDIQTWASLRSLDISPLTEAYIENGALDIAELAGSIYDQYQSNWRKLWNTLIADYDLMMPDSKTITRTSNETEDDKETRDLHTSDGGTITRSDETTGTDIRTGGSTTTDSGTESVDSTNNDSVTATTTVNEGLYGVGASGDVNTTKSVTTAPTSTNSIGNTAGETTSESELVYNALKDAHDATTTGNESRSLTGSDTGTVENERTRSLTETEEYSGASPLHTHGKLITEEVNLRSGSFANFLDIVIQDVRRSTCRLVWARSSLYE